jgi:hypothetical protein
MGTCWRSVKRIRPKRDRRTCVACGISRWQEVRSALATANVVTCADNTGGMTIKNRD